MKTFSTRPSDVRRQWRVIDADGQPVGRLATQVAVYLRGKHKPIYVPHLDVGDFVIVVNAAKVRFSGRKLEQKKYYSHSQYPGGLKVREAKHVMETRPERVIEHAVRGMLPKSSLGRHLFNHLKVYRGPEHPHAAQVNAAVADFVAPAPAVSAPHAPVAAQTASPVAALPPPETPPALPQS